MPKALFLLQNFGVTSTSTTTRSIQAIHTTRPDIATTTRPRTRAILRHRQRHILNRDVIARVNITTAHTRRPIRLFLATQVTCKVHKCHIADLHERRARESAIVATVLGDVGAIVGALHEEIGEEDVAHGAPAAASRLVVGFVRALGYEGSDPCFDVG